MGCQSSNRSKDVVHAVASTEGKDGKSTEGKDGESTEGKDGEQAKLTHVMSTAFTITIFYFVPTLSFALGANMRALSQRYKVYTVH